MRAENIDAAMQSMQRLSLLQTLGIDFSLRVKDIKGLHPLSPFSKTARKIADFHVAFLGKKINEQHCAGAVLSRCGHKTVALKCYAVRLVDDKFCEHCAELWHGKVDGNFEL